MERWEKQKNNYTARSGHKTWPLASLGFSLQVLGGCDGEIVRWRVSLDNEFSLRKSDCRSPTLLIYDNCRFYLIAAVENSGRCFCGWHKIFRVFSLSFFFVISCYRRNDWRRVCNLIINYNFIISTFKINWFFFENCISFYLSFFFFTSFFLTLFSS